MKATAREAHRLSDLVAGVIGADNLEDRDLEKLRTAEMEAQLVDAEGVLYTTSEGESPICDRAEEAVVAEDPARYAAYHDELFNNHGSPGHIFVIDVAERAYYAGLARGWELARRLQSGGAR